MRKIAQIFIRNAERKSILDYEYFWFFVKIQIRLYKEFDHIVSQYAKVFRVTNVLVGRKMVLSMSKIGNYVTLVRPKQT